MTTNTVTSFGIMPAFSFGVIPGGPQDREGDPPFLHASVDPFHSAALRPGMTQTRCAYDH